GGLTVRLIEHVEQRVDWIDSATFCNRRDRLAVQRLIGRHWHPGDVRLVPFAILFGDIRADPLTSRRTTQAVQKLVEAAFVRPVGNDLRQVRAAGRIWINVEADGLTTLSRPFAELNRLADPTPIRPKGCLVMRDLNRCVRALAYLQRFGRSSDEGMTFT